MKRRRYKLKPANIIAPIRVSHATNPTAFNAWIRHLFRSGKSYEAKFYIAQGYLMTASEYPPVKEAA